LADFITLQTTRSLNVAVLAAIPSQGQVFQFARPDIEKTPLFVIRGVDFS